MTTENKRKIRVTFVSTYTNVTLSSPADLNLDTGQLDLIDDDTDYSDSMFFGNLQKEIINVNIGGKLTSYDTYVKEKAQGIAFISDIDLDKIRQSIVNVVKKAKIR